MKKIVLLLIILLVPCACVFFKQDRSDNVIKKVKHNELIATVYEKHDNLYTVRDSKGIFYNLDLSSLNYSLKVGDNIVISYKDNLNAIKNIDQLEEEKSIYLDNGIFKAYENQAYNKLKNMTIDEKIGQLLLARIPEENQLEAITDYKLGGYILFGRDTKDENKESLKAKITSYQNISSIPLIIATDEEGGTVTRISNNKNLRETKFLSPQEIYNQSGLEGIKNTTLEMNELLSSLGINVNLAPVADVSTNESDFIYKRSLGKDASTTAKFVETVFKNQDKRLSYVLKHFPGYGNNQDTHTGVSIDNRSLESFEQNDFLPFISGINNKAEAIMVSHNIITSIKENMPASLSKNVHNMARKDLNFSGIIMTDDLDMQGVQQYSSTNAVVNAILAGNDMLIISDYKQAFQEIKKALEENILTESIINRHVFKVLSWKYYKNLINA